MSYQAADHGQPDNATEAYYYYLDGCADWGDEAMSFDDWKADMAAKRNVPVTVQEYDESPFADAYMLEAETAYFNNSNGAADFYNRFHR